MSAVNEPSFAQAFGELVDDEDVPDLTGDETPRSPDEQLARAAAAFVDADDQDIERTFDALEGLAERDEEGARSALARAMTMTAVLNVAASAWSPQATARSFPSISTPAPGKLANLWARVTKALHRLQSLVAKVKGALRIKSITLTVGTPWTISIGIEF